MRRLVKLLIAIDVVVLVAIVGIWLGVRDDAEQANVVNDGLRGSTPPAGQAWPGLAEVEDIEPAFPTRDDVRGTATMLVATCADCRSGEVIGGFLGRLDEDAVPDEARIVVLTWDGDPAAWARRWNVDPDLFELHAATTPAATDRVRRALGIGPVGGAEESGIAYLHDVDGIWRSTYFVGQLDREDIAFDLEQLAGS